MHDASGYFMTRRERLMATLNGRPVDRPAVNFYEIGGFKVNPADPDPYNIYNSPDWQPLLQMAEEHTDIIRMMKTDTAFKNTDERSRYISTHNWEDNGSKFSETRLKAGNVELKALTRRDRDVDTVWHLEHLVKNADDLKAWLELPEELFNCTFDATKHVREETAIGDRGIVMVDFPDHMNRAARLMPMEEFTIMAFTEPALMHRLFEKTARLAMKEAAYMAENFPGRLWRLTGAEYATEPYMSPDFFADYWLRYAKPVIDKIHSTGGFARVHSHGRIKNVLGMIAESGADAIDPIEPAPQGDVALAHVRERYGRQIALFGNLEINDIELLPPHQFEEKVMRALDECTGGTGRGFVLMPSASPYGRTISPNTIRNYETILRLSGS